MTATSAHGRLRPSTGSATATAAAMSWSCGRLGFPLLTRPGCPLLLLQTERRRAPCVSPQRRKLAAPGTNGTGTTAERRAVSKAQGGGGRGGGGGGGGVMAA